mgnify:FL=1|jgi:hypothetical protein
MVMGPDFSARNIFSSTLEDTDLGRQALLQSFLPEAQGFNQRNFFRNLYKPVFTDYLGAYGRAGRMGETPPTFQQYISGLDFQDMFRNQPAARTGMGDRGITSGGRFFFGR